MGITERDPASCIWVGRPQSWSGALIYHQTLFCILPGRRIQLKPGTRVVQPQEARGLEYHSTSAGSLLQMLCSNSFPSSKINFLLLGLSKFSTICCELGRSDKVINALPRSTFGLFALAFTRQLIIKQKFQSKLLLPISKPLSSVPESEDSVLPC